jgi:hypothetical protein
MKSRLEPSIYENIRTILTEARSKAYLAINKAMVVAYWNIKLLAKPKVRMNVRNMGII